MPLTHAAHEAGVSHETFYDWLTRYPDFAEAVKKAEAAFILAALQRIDDAVQKGSWQAAAWLLERKYPAQFGVRQRLALEGDANRPLVVQVREFVEIPHNCAETDLQAAETDEA